jgi:hypothetical protein
MKKKGWIKAYDFLIIPESQKDELLSSWLTRTAFSHGYSLTTFISLFVKHDGSNLTRTDIDFKNDPVLFKKLAQKSKLGYEQILQMSLRSGEGYIFDTEYNTLYPPKQIRKLKDKRTSYGLLFCPKCLAEDMHPYWRKHWRYIFYNACPKHKIFLTDRCGKCYERIRFTIMKVSSELVYCSNCGRDLRKTITKKVPKESYYGVAAIQWFEKGLQDGYFIIQDTKVYSIFIFRIYTFLLHLIDTGDKLNLRDFSILNDYKMLCKKEQNYHSRKATPIHKNFYLNAIIYHLFQNFPNNLKMFADENHLTYRDFTHDFKNIPFWYRNIIDTIIPVQNKVGRVISDCEVIGAIIYLNHIGEKVTQESVANLLGCHPTLHKGFKKVYKKVKVFK